MRSIVFMGDKFHGFFVEEVAKKRGYNYINIEEKGNIKEQTNDLLFAIQDKNAEFIVYDIEQYNNSAEEIVQQIISLSGLSSTQPIIYMSNFLPGSKLANTLIASDIKKLIFSATATELKDQLEKNMVGYFDNTQRVEIKEAIKEQEKEERIKDSFKTIGVLGSQERIGTTTQALLITRYLQVKGYKACYIDMSSNKYISFSSDGKTTFPEKVAEYFDAKVDSELGKITYKNIDMFYEQDKIADTLKLGYDFYVYDYGNRNSQSFNRASFLREDIKFIVAGITATEIDSLTKIVSAPHYKDANVILSFISEGKRNEALELVGAINIEGGGATSQDYHATRTYFADYVPDAFSAAEIELFDEIINVEDVSQPEKKKKRRIWRKDK